jgi:hypothetical protein
MAIITQASPWQGRLVEVLFASPIGDFALPDGYPAFCTQANCWIIRFVGWSAKVRLGRNRDQGTRDARFASCQDWALKPIRGDEAPEAISTDEELLVPA